jgi:hypothetical protein
MPFPDILLYDNGTGTFDVALATSATSSFGGILKCWNGATWVKSCMAVTMSAGLYDKPLKVYKAGSWQLVDKNDCITGITQVQKKSYFSTADADTHTIVLDSTPVEGNLLVMSISSDWYVNSVSGWTAGPTVAENGVGSMFWKIAGASEPTSIAVTQVNGSDVPTSGPMCIGVLEYSGIATSSPVDQENFNDADSSPLGSGAITTTQADELIVAAACFYSDTDTSITGWSNSFTQEMRVIATAGALLSLGVATRIVTATGTYSTEATAVNAATATHVGLIMSFKKA